MWWCLECEWVSECECEWCCHRGELPHDIGFPCSSNESYGIFCHQHNGSHETKNQTMENRRKNMNRILTSHNNNNNNENSKLDIITRLNFIKSMHKTHTARQRMRTHGNLTATLVCCLSWIVLINMRDRNRESLVGSLAHVHVVCDCFDWVMCGRESIWIRSFCIWWVAGYCVTELEQRSLYFLRWICTNCRKGSVEIVDFFEAHTSIINGQQRTELGSRFHFFLFQISMHNKIAMTFDISFFPFRYSHMTLFPNTYQRVNIEFILYCCYGTSELWIGDNYLFGFSLLSIALTTTTHWALRLLIHCWWRLNEQLPIGHCQSHWTWTYTQN